MEYPMTTRDNIPASHIDQATRCPKCNSPMTLVEYQTEMTHEQDSVCSICHECLKPAILLENPRIPHGFLRQYPMAVMMACPGEHEKIFRRILKREGWRRTLVEPKLMRDVVRKPHQDHECAVCASGEAEMRLAIRKWEKGEPVTGNEWEEAPADKR